MNEPSASDFDALLELCRGDREQAHAIAVAFARIADDHLELFDETPVFLNVVEGPEFRVSVVNRKVREAPYAHVVGKRLADIYPGDTPIRAAMERVHASGVAETIHELPSYFKEPAVADRYFTRSFIPLRPKPDGTKRMLVMIYEVTDAVRARLSSEAEQHRLFALLEETPAIISVLEGPDLRFVMMNRRSRELLGSRVALGMSFAGMVPPDNPTRQAALRVLATGVPETIETISRDVDGFLGRAFVITVVPIRGPDGHITSVLTASQEVTDQRRAQEVLEAQARDLEAARREAVEASRAKDEFLAMLGHELRNPLSPMMTTLEVMRMRGDPSPEIDLLWRQVQHLTRLVGDLLDVSRITRGKVELRRTDVPLATVVNRALEVASPLIEQQRNRVITELSPVTVHGDADRLVQVVTNLVTNAAKFSAPASTIRIALERRDGRARIAVADEGIGIAPDMLGRVFDAFVQQPRSVTRHGGLGLGLTIARSLVTAHGGAISATSDGPGRGSTFVIELPAVDHDRDDRRDLEPVAPPAPRPTARGATRILVVDDNRDAAVALQGALEGLGYTVAVAYDAATAIREAATFAPHVGLLDLGLPGVDGYALAATLMASHDIRLAAITGYGQPSDHERTIAAGFDAHLVKPVDLDQLAELLARLARPKQRA